MTGDKIFLDTNILVYAYDVSAGSRHKSAGEVLLDLWNTGLGIISTRVLQEFYVTVTRKVPNPLDKKQAKGIIRDFLKWNVVEARGEAILDGVDIQVKHGISFWDALIIEAAVRGGATLLYSEDFSHDTVIEGVRILNPFRER